jgi:hypothetical protein
MRQRRLHRLLIMVPFWTVAYFIGILIFHWALRMGNPLAVGRYLGAVHGCWLYALASGARLNEDLGIRQRFWLYNRQYGMYGPPPCCKRKMRIAVKVYANVSGLGGVMDSGHAMEMRCALVLISLAASEGVFRISGFKSAGSTVVPSHLSPADLAITKSHIR